MDDFNLLSHNGLYQDGEFISNAVPQIEGIYTAPGAEEPTMIELYVWIGALPPKVIIISPQNNVIKLAPVA